ncbi:MAG: phage tail sheath subtilisin-like domain-containing protein, partial [Dehalococcoidia bacterium]
MPTYLAPGVYVEELDGGSKPLEAAGTAVAAFVGFTAAFPTDDPDDPNGQRPRRVSNWTQFETLYGGLAPGIMLPHSVYGWFNNGGGAAYIARVPHTDGNAEDPQPIAVGADDFVGSESARTGINGLVVADEVTMVVIPDLITATRNAEGEIDLVTFQAVQTAAISHAEKTGDRLAILDTPPGLGPSAAASWRSETAMYDSKFATLYYPWIKIGNPFAKPDNDEPKMITVPASGHVAGIWARNDATRGVWKAPANEVVRGVLDVELKMTSQEQEQLNPIGVNCIRPFGARGTRIWGARTLSSDPSWRYVPVRRVFNFVEKTILMGTNWVVFESNDEALWQRVKRTINAFLMGLYRDGALAGTSPGDAFYVKCDAETNPPESVDEGKLVVEIGIAPLKPAEFVIFRISQWQGGAAAAE